MGNSSASLIKSDINITDKIKEDMKAYRKQINDSDLDDERKKIEVERKNKELDVYYQIAARYQSEEKEKENIYGSGDHHHLKNYAPSEGTILDDVPMRNPLESVKSKSLNIPRRISSTIDPDLKAPELTEILNEADRVYWLARLWGKRYSLDPIPRAVLRDKMRLEGFGDSPYPGINQYLSTLFDLCEYTSRHTDTSTLSCNRIILRRNALFALNTFESRSGRPVTFWHAEKRE